jgi:Calpain family cysteine protease
MPPPVTRWEVTMPVEHTGAASAVINPYALADLVAGEPIPWRRIPDPARTLEQVLATPYDELFDATYGGPLYVGYGFDKAGRFVPMRSPLFDVARDGDTPDSERPDLNALSATTIGELVTHPDFRDLLAWPIRCLDLTAITHLQVRLDLPALVRHRQLARVLGGNVLRSIAIDPNLQVAIDLGWTPPGAHWGKNGTFYKETAEFFDPVQGAVANCYYIAALSAVAWATPFRIAHHTRATGPTQDQFTDRVTFYTPDSGGVVDTEIEVTEAVPLTAGGHFIYCRSSEAGETWPAVYEKAYAKLKTPTATDMPDIVKTGWGDCVWATAQLNGGTRRYYDTASRSADDLWQILRSNCRSYRTFNPMTAWTYGKAEDAPDKVSYADAQVVGAHCYTVLGWAYRDCRRWIVLRNPWGHTEATASVLDATISMHDVSWWRPITLKNTDGTFAMEIGAFKKYFAGFGAAY